MRLKRKTWYWKVDGSNPPQKVEQSSGWRASNASLEDKSLKKGTKPCRTVVLPAAYLLPRVITVEKEICLSQLFWWNKTHTHTHTQTSDWSCHIFPSYRLNSHFYNPLFPSICLNHCLCVRLDVAVSIVTHHLALLLFIVSSMLHLLFTACHYLQWLTELHRHRPISILPKKC